MQPSKTLTRLATKSHTITNTHWTMQPHITGLPSNANTIPTHECPHIKGHVCIQPHMHEHRKIISRTTYDYNSIRFRRVSLVPSPTSAKMAAARESGSHFCGSGECVCVCACVRAALICTLSVDSSMQCSPAKLLPDYLIPYHHQHPLDHATSYHWIT